MATVVKCSPGEMSWRQGCVHCAAGLFIFACFVCMCVWACISVLHVVIFGVSPVLHHHQQRSYYCLWESTEERCSGGNEAPENRREVRGDAITDIRWEWGCVHLHTRVRNTSSNHNSNDGGVEISFIVWAFMLQVCFLTWVCLFSPLIWGNTLAVWQKSCLINQCLSACVVCVSAAKRQDMICTYLCSHSWHSLCSLPDKQGIPP